MRSKRTIGWCLSTLVVLGCAGDDEDGPLAPAEFAEVCGEAAPVQVLALAANEEVLWPLRFDDRVIVNVRTTDEESGEIGEQIVSVGACGDDPRTVTDEASRLVHIPNPGEPWLVANSLDELFWLDPTGVRAPQFISTGSLIASEGGANYLVVPSEDKSSADLVRMTANGDAFTLESLVTGLDLVSGEAYGGNMPGTAVVLALDGQLLEVSVADGATSTLATGVSRFTRSNDGRFVAWEAARDVESASLLQPWYVHDRETRAIVQATDDEPISFDQGAALTTSENPEFTTVVLLPGLQRHTLRGWWVAVFEPTDDGRYVALELQRGPIDPRTGEQDVVHQFWVFDAADAEPRRLPYVGPPGGGRIVDGEVWLTRERDHRREIVALPIDGSAPHRIVSDVGSMRWLGNDRFSSQRKSGDATFGDLVLLELGEPARLVAENADLSSIEWEEDADVATGFFYEVRDDARDRHALYFAALAP